VYAILKTTMQIGHLREIIQTCDGVVIDAVMYVFNYVYTPPL